MAKLNPAWLAHNDLYNEGGEGFNPHAKYVAQPVSVAGGVARMVAGKRRTHAEAVRFAKVCLSGAQKVGFLAEVQNVFPENYAGVAA